MYLLYASKEVLILRIHFLSVTTSYIQSNVYSEMHPARFPQWICGRVGQDKCLSETMVHIIPHACLLVIMLVHLHLIGSQAITR